MQQAMGFRFPAQVVFDRMVLTDEAAEKQLLINLADRDLISHETLMERFGETPEIEQVRIRREARRRRDGMAPPKASPFHTPQQEHEYKKLFIQQGTVTPSEVGVEMDPKKDGEKPPVEMSADFAPKPAPGAAPSGKPKGQPGQGRPKQSRDSTKRKQKRVTPRSGAAFMRDVAWAENTLSRIGQLAAPAYLARLGKKNLRELTDQETRSFESFKFRALCRFEPGGEFGGRELAAVAAGDLTLPAFVAALLRETVARHVESHGKEPTLEALRRYQSGAYALWKSGSV